MASVAMKAGQCRQVTPQVLGNDDQFAAGGPGGEQFLEADVETHGGELQAAGGLAEARLGGLPLEQITQALRGSVSVALGWPVEPEV